MGTCSGTWGHVQGHGDIGSGTWGHVQGHGDKKSVTLTLTLTLTLIMVFWGFFPLNPIKKKRVDKMF